MRGITRWIIFHADWYLDHRQSDWQLEEGLSWVKYVACDEGELVYVHADYAKHIVDVLSWNAKSSDESLTDGARGTP